MYLRNNIIRKLLISDKDVNDYLIEALDLEVGSVFFQRFETRTHLIVELHDKITAKQIRKIENETGTALDNIALHYNPINDHHCVDLVFKK